MSLFFNELKMSVKRVLEACLLRLMVFAPLGFLIFRYILYILKYNQIDVIVKSIISHLKISVTIIFYFFLVNIGVLKKVKKLCPVRFENYVPRQSKGIIENIYPLKDKWSSSECLIILTKRFEIIFVKLKILITCWLT